MARIHPYLSPVDRQIVIAAFERARGAGLERPACYRAAVEKLQAKYPGSRKDIVAFRTVALLMKHVRLETICRETVSSDSRERSSAAHSPLPDRR